MGSISAAQYEAYRTQMKNQLGVSIEKNSTGTANYIGGFNGISEADKQEIAKTFDSKLDLQLQADIAKVMKQCGVNRYIDLINNPKAAKMLKDLGICVQSLDKNGNVKQAKNGDRNWLISRVDKDGNVIKDEKGGLAQFKMKDFNSDSYIQNCELYVNDLLKIAGYDCMSSLDLSPAELAELASMQGSSSGIGVGGSQSGALNQQNQNRLLQQMLLQSGQKIDPLTGQIVEDNEEDADSKTKVSRAKFEELVDELIEESKDENGETTMTRTKAEEKIGEDYVIDQSFYSLAL